MPKAAQISEAKLAANRANAQLSTGPVSEAGKAKVSLNAVKTGLTGRTVLLPADDVAAYEATVARFHQQWQPQTEEESILVQSLADTDWRMQRIPGLEYGIYATGELEFADEFADQTDPQVRRTLIQTKVFIAYRKQLTNLQTQESRLRRQRQQDEERLRKLQADRKYDEFKRQQRESASLAVTAPAAGFEFSNTEGGPRAPINGRSVEDILAEMRSLVNLDEDLTEDAEAA